MRLLWISLIILFNFILQTTLFKHIQIFGISPDFMIVIIVSFAIIRHEVEGALIGFFAGLLQDILFGSPIGINALLYGLIGYFSGKPFKEFYVENYFFPLLLVGLSTFFYNLGYYVIHFLLRARLDFSYYFFSIIFPATIYNMALSMPLYAIIYLINRRIEKAEKYNRRLFSKNPFDD